MKKKKKDKPAVSKDARQLKTAVTACETNGPAVPATLVEVDKMLHQVANWSAGKF